VTAPQQPTPRGEHAGPLALGVLLIGAGIFFLVGQQLGVAVEWAWPFFVIVPGVVMLAAGLAFRATVGLAIAGSIVTVTGLLLLYQNATGHWESWAYAWALAAPGAPGLGLLLHGLIHGRPGQRRGGLNTLTVGLVLFLVGALFFEGVIGISDQALPLPGWAWPLALIALGVLVLARGLLRGRSATS
jgi:hypothetical protein